MLKSIDPILNADVLTPVPSYRGLLRLKADVVQQLNADQFQAYGAAITSSRIDGRLLLASDRHLIGLVAYIHQNPLKHGFVDKVMD